MRVTLLGMERRTLPTVFEAPPGADQPEYSAFYIRPHPRSSAVAIPLFGRNGVTAVWDSETGKLLWHPEPGGDIGWSPDGLNAYVLAGRFGPPGPRAGFGHQLLRYSWPGRELQEELLFSVPSGGADSLVVSRSAGWRRPSREGEPNGWGWKVVWGPQFRGEGAFRLWLPDGSPLDLRLPLAETVEVPVLRTTWQSPHRYAGPGAAPDRRGI